MGDYRAIVLRYTTDFKGTSMDRAIHDRISGITSVIMSAYEFSCRIPHLVINQFLHLKIPGMVSLDNKYILGHPPVNPALGIGNHLD